MFKAQLLIYIKNQDITCFFSCKIATELNIIQFILYDRFYINFKSAI